MSGGPTGAKRRRRVPPGLLSFYFMPKVKEFLQEVKVEFKKVSWPTRKILQKFTILVIIVVILLSIFTGILDTIFSKFISIFLR